MANIFFFNKFIDLLIFGCVGSTEYRLQIRRLSSCGSRDQLLRGMWDLPRAGLEPVFPALAGRLSTTVPPGKPLANIFEGQNLSYWSNFFYVGQSEIYKFKNLIIFMNLIFCVLLVPSAYTFIFYCNLIY